MWGFVASFCTTGWISFRVQVKRGRDTCPVVSIKTQLTSTTGQYMWLKLAISKEHNRVVSPSSKLKVETSSFGNVFSSYLEVRMPDKVQKLGDSEY